MTHIFRDKFFINFSFDGNEKMKKKVFIDKYGKNIIKKYRKTTITNTIYKNTPTFREFVEYVLDEPLHKHNMHWCPAYLLCLPCQVKYNFIGK